MCTCLLVPVCVYVCVHAQTHDEESVSVSLEPSGGRGQLAPLRSQAAGTLPRHPWGPRPPSPGADIWRLSAQQRRRTMQLKCIAPVSEDRHFRVLFMLLFYL